MPHIHTELGQHDHTASAFIIRWEENDGVRTPFLLLHLHKKYNKLLQPGGHVELHETPWQAILHEIVEETGYSPSQLAILQPSVTTVRKLGRGVVHPIPVCHNTHAADEPHTHSHTDISYLFSTHQLPVGLPAEGESALLKWVTHEELNALSHEELSSITREIGEIVFEIVEQDEWLSHPITEFGA